MSYRELNTGTRGGSEDYRGKGIITRLFRVDTPDKAVAVQEVIDKEGGYDSEFPGRPEFVVDNIGRADGEGGVTTDVTLIYSSDRRGALPPRINKDKAGYYGFRESMTSQDIKFPYAKREPTQVPGLSNQPPQKKLIWTIFDDRLVAEPRGRLSLNVVTPWDMSRRLLVKAQINKIHTIGGGEYLFVGAEIVQRADDNGTYDVTYSWLDDPGSEAVDQDSYDDAAFTYPILPREPYHEWVGILNPLIPPDQLNGKPLFFSHPRFKADKDGWKTLPAIPNL